MNAIRHISTTNYEDVIALGEFESRVQMWRRQPPGKISEFLTVLDFGGRRLELSLDGTRCYAAAYYANGIACYDSHTGALLWQRKDLKKIQTMRCSISGNGVYCFFDTGAAQLLSDLNGETLSKHPGVRDIIQSPFASIDLVVKKDIELRSRDSQLIRKIQRSTFALLSASFSPQLLLTSESGGSLRCFDASTGMEMWGFSPAKGEHFLNIGYSELSQCFYGVSWPYEKGGQMQLFRIETDGKISPLLILGEPSETAFCNGELITSEGDVIDLESLQVTRLWPPPNNSFKPTPLPSGQVMA